MVAKSPFPVSDICDYCGEFSRSPYTFKYGGDWYSGHKRCMGAPMVRKLERKLTPPSTPPNIALTGAMRSGKDTVADYLVANYGYTRFAFGDELKRYAHEIFSVDTANKPRELYQWFGQTMRQRDPDVWVRKCFGKIFSERCKHINYYLETLRMSCAPKFMPVITDLRQPSEFTRCRAEGYVIIRVKAPSDLRIHRAIESADKFAMSDLTHETESHVDGFAVDYEVENTGTLAELYAQVDAVMAGVNTITAVYPV